MDKKFLQAELKASGDTIEIIASDETLDRHGDKLDVEAWDLKNFKRNPVLLVNHEHKIENIVGRAENIRVEKAGTKRRLIFKAVLHDLTEKAKAVKQMVEAGFLKSVSVGFLWKQISDGKGGNSDSFELLEISFVTVGANPNAMIMNGIDMKGLLEKTDALPEADQLKVKEFSEKESSLEEVDIAPAKPAIKTLDELNEFLKNKDLPETVDLGIILLKTLLTDSEKLKTLTQSGQGKNGEGRSFRKRNKDADILDRGAKEAVGILMRTLQLSKKEK